MRYYPAVCTVKLHTRSGFRMWKIKLGRLPFGRFFFFLALFLFVIKIIFQRLHDSKFSLESSSNWATNLEDAFPNDKSIPYLKLTTISNHNIVFFIFPVAIQTTIPPTTPSTPGEIYRIIFDNYFENPLHSLVSVFDSVINWGPAVFLRAHKF